MKTNFRSPLRVIFTVAIVAGAGFVVTSMWDYYMKQPWTRNAHVRSDVVSIAPDVSGLVSEVMVRDNQQVRKGDVLFLIDQQRFTIALKQAEAGVDGALAVLAQAQRDRDRREKLVDAVSEQQKEQARLQVVSAETACEQALAARDLARLNLERSKVRAPVNGKISNLTLRPGNYVTAGKAEVALLDTDSIRVEGYFEETKLPRIHVGSAVSIRLMGLPGELTGHVESIAAGIEDRERTPGTGMLANINPTFSWVRLAQRVPVRISIDDLSVRSRLIAGLSATVAIRD